MKKVTEKQIKSVAGGESLDGSCKLGPIALREKIRPGTKLVGEELCVKSSGVFLRLAPKYRRIGGKKMLHLRNRRRIMNRVSKGHGVNSCSPCEARKDVKRTDFSSRVCWEEGLAKGQ